MNPDQEKYNQHTQNSYDQGNENNQEDMKFAAWVCPKCQTINQTGRCVTCGYVRTIKRGFGDMLHNNKQVPLLLVALVFLVLLIGAGGSLRCILGHDFQPATCEHPEMCSNCGKTVGNSLNHTYEPATCTDPKTCTLCHKTEGDSLGHLYSAATCSSPSKCSRCGDTTGKALAHKWIDATYESPKKCTLCGKTSGNVKGYYASLPCDWSTKRVSVGGTNTTPLVFDKTVKNCTKFTLHFQISDVKSGNPYGKFTVYAKINSKWEKIGTYNVKNNSEVVKTFKFDKPITFKQLAVAGPYRYSGNYNFYMWIEDWYLQN
ncbi:MAG: hypothetical protein IJN20_05420 [Oscillospiraceae bacterium]|nr:hypothetical protein [Oscillospiraceae bacterium]